MKRKRILIISICIFLMISVFYIIDYKQVKSINNPIFMIKIKNKDNNEYYLGLGYIFLRGKERFLDNSNISTRKMKFGPIFFPFDISTISFNDYISLIKIVNYNDSCSNQFIEYYKYNNQTLYLNCIDDINIINGNIKKTLREEMNNSLIPFYYIDSMIINNFTLIDADNEKSLYKMNTNLGDNITIIKCDTLEGNKDIYIGPSNMKFDNIYCK